MIDLLIEEERSRKDNNDPGESPFVRTRIHVIVTPQMTRNRRRNDILRKANELLASLSRIFDGQRRSRAFVRKSLGPRQTLARALAGKKVRQSWHASAPP